MSESAHAGKAEHCGFFSNGHDAPIESGRQCLRIAQADHRQMESLLSDSLV